MPESTTKLDVPSTTLISPSSPTDVMLPLELTLIVAATTRTMGIGRAGGLPWTGLKKEMAYFRKVTQKVSSDALPAQNTVLMGRKTYESIPPKFRPLNARVNIVLSRSYNPPATLDIAHALGADAAPVNAPSLVSAVRLLRSAEGTSRGRVFVIGGAEVYKAALEEVVENASVKRVLLTRVLTDVECDTFFPLRLEENGSCEDERWRKRSMEELRAWAGVDVPEGPQVEGGLEYVFEMWERE